MKESIVLASASPRRKELLEQMGLDFEIMPAEGDEVLTQKRPELAVMELAEQKAKEVSARLWAADPEKTYLVIGADTVVSCEGEILGKPKDREDAKGMLRMLSGKTHQVFTGVSVIRADDDGETVHTFYDATDVTFYPMAEEEIESYVETGEPDDKAGAYGIQGKGALYIKRIEGDYFNVVGLPIGKLYHEIWEKRIII